MANQRKHLQKFLRPGSYRLIVNRIPNVEWNVQQITLPQLTIGVAVQPSWLKNVSQAGDKLDYSTFDVTFTVDEDLENYMEIVNWIHGIAAPEFSEQRARLEEGDGLYSDISLMLLTNNNTPNIEFIYTRCFPTNLTGFNMDTSLAPDSPITATVSFEFTNFRIKKLNQD